MCTGALAGKAEPVAAVRSMHNVLGGTIDPHAAYLMLRGMKTLDVRVQRQNQVGCLMSSAAVGVSSAAVNACTNGVYCLLSAAQPGCMVEGLYSFQSGLAIICKRSILLSRLTFD